MVAEVVREAAVAVQGAAEAVQEAVDHPLPEYKQ
jgi:hypothetical protein